jgi:type II secretory pathway component PulC
MSDEEKVFKEYLRLTPYNREDDIVAFGVELNEDLAAADLNIGDQITMTVVGIERKNWEGLRVQ